MLNKNEVIVTDVDQVLLDYIGGLREYLNKRDGKFLEGHPDNWDMTSWLNLSAGETPQDLIREFSLQYKFGTLDALPGADVVLHELVREGYKLICLTACGSDPITVALRKANLFHRFGDIFDDILFVDYTESKAETLNRIAEEYDIMAFIDDKPANIEDAIYRANVNNSILMKSPHNREFREANPDICQAFSWYDCKRFINQFSQDSE